MPGIKIEAWRAKRGPAHCHRCQAFKHASHGCHRRLACVRCKGEHPARECQRPLEEPATCANCAGPHSANHSACLQYRHEVRHKRAGTVALSQPKATRRPTGQSSAPIAVNMVSTDSQAITLMTPANPLRRREESGGRRGGRRRDPGPTTPPPQRRNLHPCHRRLVLPNPRASPHYGSAQPYLRPNPLQLPMPRHRTSPFRQASVHTKLSTGLSTPSRRYSLP